MDKNQLAQKIDHTLLKADATEQAIRTVCQEAIDYNTASVCVNSYWVPIVHELLEETKINTVAVVGFPLGAMSTESKTFEAKNAIDNGADEIDMVMNIGQMLSGNYDEVLNDIKSVADVVHDSDKVLKVILENALIGKDLIEKACHLAEEAGADYVKTSTGFSTSGAKLEDVELMRKSVSPHVKIKAAGGIRDKETAIKMLKAGADRLGLSSTLTILAE
ncbi:MULTISPECIES: deoxyribose-phosphate aldolase [Aerococcus]|uniref:Deoxyribose-phosphate aldolase n=1 Tax=Aerococcus mictus TaxID=2976810 RepID=A0A9Q4DFS6_9LACT|nr:MULTISPECIES: deoxyribose-phosphate aldolase [Aerococcus]AEA01315.1 deoxyribose-phosphate aldolase [Aerococcus sp. Group 1]KAA9290294.1 deoxyribose-phosphate aldolase [Aerococcus mictus]MCY3031500.1 deoxyribose-phosphate aldolase [Aerococcus sp. Group 1]MCY3039803.1 deoxyribose-phosphate aldolase [Aerococcus sp. Group 2]MCY3041611.1 deoxyribose-phosphate aldolase [Aerococcus sp. Group 2]